MMYVYRLLAWAACRGAKLEGEADGIDHSGAHAVSEKELSFFF